MSADSRTLTHSATAGHPEWLDDLDDPAVRAGVRDKQHKPDYTSDEPQPACGAPVTENIDWQAEERDHSRTQCHHQRCWGESNTQDGGPPQHVQDAAEDRDQLGLEDARWSE